MTSPTNALPQRRILICEPERHILRLLQVNLERQGHRVVSATTVEEALASLDAEIDSVILADSLPDHGAYEVLTHLRTAPEHSQVWVAVLVMDSADLQRWQGLPFQPNKYVIKPFNPADLFP